MFEDRNMTPRDLYKLIADTCEGRYDTIEYVEKTQYTHVISLTRAGLKDIDVKCTKPYEHSVTYENAMATLDHIKDVYSEREVVWWNM